MGKGIVRRGTDTGGHKKWFIWKPLGDTRKKSREAEEAEYRLREAKELREKAEELRERSQRNAELIDRRLKENGLSEMFRRALEGE